MSAFRILAATSMATWAMAGFQTASIRPMALSGVLAMAFSSRQWAWVW